MEAVAAGVTGEAVVAGVMGEAAASVMGEAAASGVVEVAGAVGAEAEEDGGRGDGAGADGDTTPACPTRGFAPGDIPGRALGVIFPGDTSMVGTGITREISTGNRGFPGTETLLILNFCEF